MRIAAVPVVALSLVMGVPLSAQAQAGKNPSGSETQQQSVTIRNIQVVDIEDLQSDTRSKVDALVSSTKQEELQSLRASIEATPAAISALKAKGRTTEQVVAINVDENGTLTMFTKRVA